MLLIALLIIGCITFFNTNTPISMLLITYGYVFVCLLGGYLYFVIKNKKLINPFKNLMGIGDVCYFIAVIPFFNLSGFVVYFILGLVFSMILFIGLKKSKREAVNTIPLAGFLALFFIIFKLVDSTGVYNLFYNTLF